jgi:hypothetical protein
MKKPGIITAVLVCCMQFTSASPHPSLPSDVVPDGLGVNIHFTDPAAGEMEMLAAGGFHWVRMDFSWGRTERERGKYDFSPYDRLLASLEAHKMRGLFILDYGNDLYQADGAVTTVEAREAFARWAAAAVVHFRGHGILWEIWNEPNIGFWKPKPDVGQYIALALATSEAIHKAAPEEAVIGPATSGVDLGFLEECFKAGLLERWAAVSVHPYRQSPPETAALDYLKLRRLINRHAPNGKTIPILSAEWGYSAAWKGYDADIQGRMLPRQWLSNLAQGVPLSIWYDWHDDGTDAKEAEHHFGTVAHAHHGDRDPAYDPKPAYLAARTLSSVLKGFRFAKRIAVGGADDYVMLFTKGDERVLAIWTIAVESHSLKIPCSAGRFELVRHTGERPAPVTVEADTLTITVDDAPQYLISGKANALLDSAAAVHPLHATLSPLGSRMMVAQVENLGDSPFRGTVQLTRGDAGQAVFGRVEIDLPAGEAVSTLTFPLDSAADQDIFAGLRIEGNGGVLFELPARRFHALPESLLANCRLVPDGDATVASTHSTAVVSPPEPMPGGDLQVLRINFRCDDGWKFLRLVPRQDELASLGGIEGRPTGFGFWIHSDGTCISPRLRVTDKSGQCWQPSGADTTWTGWRFVEMKLNSSSGHWGGANDGKIHHPLRWDSIFLLDNTSRREIEGAIHIAAPVVIY